jgi:hypothetical protein
MIIKIFSPKNLVKKMALAHVCMYCKANVELGKAAVVGLAPVFS